MGSTLESLKVDHPTVELPICYECIVLQSTCIGYTSAMGVTKGVIPSWPVLAIVLPLSQ